jgi:hypothetical protein
VGECDQLEPGAELQLVQDAAQVGFDGGFGDEQALRHFAVAEAFGREQKDVPLPHGEDVKYGQVRTGSGSGAGGMFEEGVDGSWGDDGVAGVNGADGGQQEFRFRAL